MKTDIKSYARLTTESEIGPYGSEHADKLILQMASARIRAAPREAASVKTLIGGPLLKHQAQPLSKEAAILSRSTRPGRFDTDPKIGIPMRSAGGAWD